MHISYSRLSHLIRIKHDPSKLAIQAIFILDMNYFDIKAFQNILSKVDINAEAAMFYHLINELNLSY